MDCSNLKKGDKVAVIYHSIVFPTILFREVEKVNKITIKVDGNLFYKDGGVQQSERWNSATLATIEDGLELKKKIKHEQSLRRVNVAIQSLGLKSSPELVSELLSIIDRYQ